MVRSSSLRKLPRFALGLQQDVGPGCRHGSQASSGGLMVDGAVRVEHKWVNEEVLHEVRIIVKL